jgi:Sulfotransferase family
MTDLLQGKRLVFLIGAPRSGTTWLQLMLASVHEVASANETHLFTNYMPSLFRGWDRLRDSPRDVGLHHLVTQDQYLSSIRDFAAQALAAIAATKPDASVILEKTPGHAFVWRDIVRVFPDASFLHLVRDPRAVIASLLAAKQDWENGDWIPTRITSACEFWSQHVTSAAAAKQAGRYHEARYEDLREPATLRRIFAFLGVERSDPECSSIISSYAIDKLRKNEASAPWSLAREPRSFFRRGENEGWRGELSPAAIATIEASLGKLMSTYGYPVQERRTVRRTLAVRITQSGDRARDFLRRRAQGLAERLR